MLPINVTFDTGEETKGGRKRKETKKKTSLKINNNYNKVRYNRGTVDKSRHVSVKRLDSNSFSTSIYRKETFTGLYTKWDSFTPRRYKVNLIRTLTYRCLCICSSSSLLQSALNDLKDLLSRNGYPRGVITYNMNDVVNRNRNKPKDLITTVPKRDVFIVLPYLGLQSKFITKQLKVTRPSFFWGISSYFEALWYPHLYFYRKSNT